MRCERGLLGRILIRLEKRRAFVAFRSAAGTTILTMTAALPQILLALEVPACGIAIGDRAKGRVARSPIEALVGEPVDDLVLDALQHLAAALSDRLRDCPVEEGSRDVVTRGRLLPLHPRAVFPLPQPLLFQPVHGPLQATGQRATS